MLRLPKHGRSSSYQHARGVRPCDALLFVVCLWSASISGCQCGAFLLQVLRLELVKCRDSSRSVGRLYDLQWLRRVWCLRAAKDGRRLFFPLLRNRHPRFLRLDSDNMAIQYTISSHVSKNKSGQTKQQQAAQDKTQMLLQLLQWRKSLRSSDIQSPVPSPGSQNVMPLENIDHTIMNRSAMVHFLGIRNLTLTASFAPLNPSSSSSWSEHHPPTHTYHPPNCPP